MSGFKDDVISILKQNHLFEREAVGWIMSIGAQPERAELVHALEENKIPITTKDEKIVVNYDFVVLDRWHYDVGLLLTALTRTSTSGIIIIEATERSYTVKNLNGFSLFGEFRVVTVMFDNRQYFVMRKGSDYGD
jgi:hypothetical protein